MLVADRELVDKVSPGTRVVVTCVSSVFERQEGRASKGASLAVRTPYLQVVGIAVVSEGSGRMSTNYSPQEEEAFRAMSRHPDIYEKMSESIAPSISGEYTVNIKKAIACLLFGKGYLCVCLFS